ncbi:MAG: chemotaxis response regulator protein-glutamate methylesterase [Vicinamibacterales bacterium]
MKKVRALVVDDAVVVRRMVTDVLSEDPEIEVAGAAANGRIALQKLTQVNPDIVTLDIEMPEMNGLETLAAIRKTHPTLPVIMFSTLTERGAAATLEALSLGASDYVTKPANVGSVALAQQRIRDELIPKVKALCRVKADPAPALDRHQVPAATPLPRVAPALPRQAVLSTGTRHVDIVAIGVSTGGPNALAAVLPELPADFPVPIVLVQHMPPMFTRLLAERLDSQSSLTVREAAGGEALAPGHVYIAPGNYHLVLQRKGTQVVTALNQDPPENSCRPAVDPLFRSVSEVYGTHVLAVVLTGMGQDGLRGVEHIHAAGGQVIVQDEGSSVVWGMPGFVAKAGLADRVLPLKDIPVEITRRTLRAPGLRAVGTR